LIKKLSLLEGEKLAFLYLILHEKINNKYIYIWALVLNIPGT